MPDVESDRQIGEMVQLATELREAHPADVGFAQAAFEWVRDNVDPSYDVRDSVKSPVMV